MLIPEAQYASFCRELVDIHAIKSTRSRRNGMEQRYFAHHKALGVKLRGKYRPQ